MNIILLQSKCDNVLNANKWHVKYVVHNFVAI